MRNSGTIPSSFTTPGCIRESHGSQQRTEIRLRPGLGQQFRADQVDHVGEEQPSGECSQQPPEEDRKRRAGKIDAPRESGEQDNPGPPCPVEGPRPLRPPHRDVDRAERLGSFVRSGSGRRPRAFEKIRHGPTLARIGEEGARRLRKNRSRGAATGPTRLGRGPGAEFSSNPRCASGAAVESRGPFASSRFGGFFLPRCRKRRAIRSGFPTFERVDTLNLHLTDIFFIPVANRDFQGTARWGRSGWKTTARPDRLTSWMRQPPSSSSATVKSASLVDTRSSSRVPAETASPMGFTLSKKGGPPLDCASTRTVCWMKSVALF